MFIKFSIRTLLILIAIFCVCLIGLMNPNRLWHELITIGVPIFVVIAIPTMIGAKGKQRLKLLSFIVLCAGSWIVADQYQESGVMRSQQKLVDALDQIIGSSKRLTPDGEMLIRRSSTDYRITDAFGSRQGITIDEIESRGLERYVVDRTTGISYSNFYNICNSIIAFLLGLAGFFITGWVYEMQNAPTAVSAR